MNFDASNLVGKKVKDENNFEEGRIISFLIDRSGKAEEVLVENRNGKLVRYPVGMLGIEQDQVFLVSNVERRVKILSKQLPAIDKKRKILGKLLENKMITSAIHDKLCKEFDKTMKEMKNEAKTLLDNMDTQVDAQEKQVEMLQLARAFLEIEHGIGTVEDQAYQQSIMSILKEIKSAQQKKLDLFSFKEKIAGILQPKKETEQEQQEQPRPDQVKEVKSANNEAPRIDSSTETVEPIHPVPVRVT